jgi:hypothetical protein
MMAKDTWKMVVPCFKNLSPVLSEQNGRNNGSCVCLLNMLSYTRLQQASSGAAVRHTLQDRTVPMRILVLAET